MIIRKIFKSSGWRATRHGSLIHQAAIFLSLSISSSCLANLTSIDSVRVHQSPERTRIVFDLSAPVEHKIFALSNPRRLVIDLQAAELKTGFSHIDLTNTPIKAIRSAARGGSDLRIVLDLRDQVKPRSFPLKPILQYGDRLVVDLYTAGQQIAPVEPKSDRISSQMKDVIIAIDAGHGGEDPGAIGDGKLYEKDVVMAIASRLKEYFSNEPGYKALMIRKGDYYVGLRKRTEIARKSQADVLLSIHADAFKTAEAKGASVYAISQQGATSEAAKWLAEKENRADLMGGVGGLSLNDKDDQLAELLLDLSMTARMAEGLEMGQSVLKSIKPVTRLHKKQVEQAAFAVLKSPDIPSLLIEIGYISNPAEAELLRSARYQKKMAKAIFEGVVRYVDEHPPPGSFIAWKSRGGADRLATYEIESGDTLSSIAVRYRVTAKSLMKINGLSSEAIRIGQILKIPTT